MTNPSLINRRGFSLLGVLLVIGLSGIMVAGVVTFTGALGELQLSTTEMSVANCERTLAQSSASLGLDPTALSNNPLASVGRLTTTSTRDVTSTNRSGTTRTYGFTGNASVGEGRGTNSRAAAAGLQVSNGQDSAGTVRTPIRQLAAPTFALTDWTIPTVFPITGLVIPAPTNPDGVIYRYTIDGTDPLPTSPQWLTITYAERTFPATLKVRAFYPTPDYAPSDVATLRLQYPLVEFTLSRENGSQNPNWIFSEMFSQTNPGRLWFNVRFYDMDINWQGVAKPDIANGERIYPRDADFFNPVVGQGRVYYTAKSGNPNFPTGNGPLNGSRNFQSFVQPAPKCAPLQ